jgi:hypothetical protein
MPSPFLFDSVALLTGSIAAGVDALGRPMRAEAPERTSPCRVSRPSAADLESGRDGKHVIEAVLFLPLGATVVESDRIEVDGRCAAMVAPAVTVSAPSGLGYVRVPVRWVSDAT